MARRTLKAKILNIEPDPMHAGRTIVSVNLTEGEQSWNQAVSIKPKEPLSYGEFLEMFARQEYVKIEPPVDPLGDLRKNIDVETEITVVDKET